MLTPARIMRRDATRFTKLRSRRTSRPHVSKAIDTHERPPRGLAAEPSRTVTTVTMAVVSSTTPRATVAIVKSVVCPAGVRTTGIDTMIVPAIGPRIDMTPTRALARPTCEEGTRSGT